MSQVELDTLLKTIFKQKKVEVTLHFDSECRIEADDIKPLVKVINYLINYLQPLTHYRPDISLKKQSNGCLLCFVISTDERNVPPISRQVEEVLHVFKAGTRIVFEEAKYLQILIHFCTDRVPDSIVIEV